MKILPLYPTVPEGPLSSASPRAPSKDCTGCACHLKAQTVAMRPEGVIGGTFYVADHPDGRSDETGRPFNGLGGSFLRRTLDAMPSAGKALFGYALSCKPVGEPEDEHLAACAGHLRWAIERAKPSRIVALGSLAARALIGEGYQALSARKGYGWHFDADGMPTPVFFLIDPAEAAQNSLLGRAFKEDLAAALVATPKCLPLQRHAVHVVETVEDSMRAADNLSGHHVYMDTETSGLLHSEGFRVECVTVWKDGERHGYVWPRKAIENADVVDGLHRVLALSEHSGFNLKYDMQACASDPLVGPIAKIRSDARIKRKLHEADADGSLAQCAKLVGLGGHKKEAEAVVDAIVSELSKLSVADELTPTGKARKPPVLKYVDPTKLVGNELALIRSGVSELSFAYRWIPDEILWRYNGLDVLASMHVDHWADARLAPGPRRVWEGVSLPAIKALAVMESNGLPIDVGMLDTLNFYLSERVKGALAACHVHVPGLNPSSPPQVLAALAALGIKPKLKKGKVSTDEVSLAPFKDKFPLIGAILEYRRLVKLHKTYGIGLRRAVRGDGRVHPSALLDGASSGRISIENPSAQNIPRNKDEDGNEDGKLIRDCICAPDGRTLVEGDFSQLEIRKAAYLSHDPVMVAFLNTGKDFHQQSADLMGLDRTSAKTTTFAVLYELPEMLGFLVSKRLKVSAKRGNEIADLMFGKFKRLKAWMLEQLAQAQERGGAATVWDGQEGRFRPLWHLASYQDYMKGQHDNAKRSTWNTPCQGSAADLMTSSLWPVVLALREEVPDAKLVLTVHDSIMVECGEGDEVTVARILKRVMLRFDLGDVPLAVEIKKGRRWGSMEVMPPETYA